MRGAGARPRATPRAGTRRARAPGAAIASYDYDAFLGERAGAVRGTTVTNHETDHRKRRRVVQRGGKRFARRAGRQRATRNVARARGGGGAPWAADDPTDDPSASRDKDSRVRGLPTVPAAR